MAATTKHRRDSKPFAIIRSYQPIRIERELLAQVFDLAELGLPDGLVHAAEQSAATDQVVNPRTNEPTQHGLLDRFASQQGNELEAVA